MFVVIEGEYSDWDILGYFETREEADKYCIGTDAYTAEVGKLSLTEKQQKTTVHRAYTVEIQHIDGKVWAEDWNYNLYSGVKRKLTMSNGVHGYNFKITAKSPAQAKKIACDYMAKKKAEEAGL